MPDKNTKKLQPQELATFFESLTMLISAGVPANECPDIIAGDTKGSRLAAAMEKVNRILNEEDVYILSEAMEKSSYFPEYAIEMIRLGEESGRIETTCDALGEYYRQQEALNQSIKSAISGPLLLLVMMSVVLLFLILLVLPIFENVFASLGVNAGNMSSAFMAARVSMIIVGVLLAGVLALVISYLLPGGRERLASITENFPLTSRIHYTISASRLTNGIAMLLASGISIGEALGKAGNLVDNKKIKEKIPAAIEEVNNGEDLGKVLVVQNVLDGFEAKILLSASRAGQTDVAMRRLSDIYAKETNASIDRLLGLIEPALVGLLSAAIGIILLSVMLPLTNIMSAIG